MFAYCLLALCLSAARSLAVRALVSNATPADLRQAVLQVESHSGAFVVVTSSPLADLPSPSISFDGVLDVLWSESLSRLLLSAEGPEHPIINGNEYPVRGSIPLDIDAGTEVEALSRVAQWLRVRRVCVFLSPLGQQLPLVSASFEGVALEVFRIHEDATRAEIGTVVRRLVVPFGFTSFLVFLPPQTTKKLLLEFEINQLTTNRLVILLSSRAAQYRFVIDNEEMPEFKYINPLFVTQRECTEAHTLAELLLCKVRLSLSTCSTTETLLMWIANSTALKIGCVHEDKIELSEFQENQLRPNSSGAFPAITVSVNGSEMDPSEYSGFRTALAVRGAVLAVAEINSGVGILPFSTLHLSNVSLGVDEFNVTWVQEQLKSSELGVAHLPGLRSSMAFRVYREMRNMHISIPQVGATTTLPEFSSKVQFPLFTRVTTSDAYLSVTYTRMMKHFKWTHVCIVYIDNLWSETLAQLIIDEGKKLNIEVCNNHRKVSNELQSSSLEFLKVAQEVVDSKVRVLLILASKRPLLMLIQALYDLGMRGGDLVMFAVEWLVPTLYDISDPNLLKAVKELTQGAIMFYPSSFVGASGAAVMQKYYSEYRERMPVQGCYYYDATLAIAHALDFVVAKGMNWHNATVLDAAIRGVRFTGCTGLVTIEQSSNDRSPMSYTILNARIQPEGSMKIEVLGEYDPLGLVLFRFDTDIQWPGFSSSIPTDIRENVPGCPFEPRHSVHYQPAMALSTAIIASVFLVSICSSTYTWKKYWNFGVKPLSAQVQASSGDYLVFVAIGIEAGQLMATGLKLQDWAVLLTWSAHLLALRFEAFASLESSAYWCIFYTATAAVAVWTASLTLAKMRSSRGWKCVCNRAELIAEAVCPVLGDICFIPVVSTLLAIFQCTKIASKPSEDPTLYRAYLEWDCNQFCWGKSHLAFAVVSVICLLAYIPSAVYMRPAWQHVPISLHIHSSPAFLMIKSIYQMTVIAVDRILKAESSISAQALFLALTVLFTVATARIRPFNYSRANLWHFLSLLFVVYTAVLHILSDQLSSNSNVAWLMLLYLGFLLIFAFGLIYQRIRLPSKFKSRKSIEVTELFRFMFSRGSRYLHLFAKSNRVSSDDEGVSNAHRFPIIQHFSTN